MCVLYVETLCAGRFGLGWVHYVFNVASHISCIFHAYVPLFSIFLILIVFGAFLLLSLSLSLSPSFYLVSLHMAPKRKSTPSWNPFHSGASSFSLPVDFTPFHVRFRDEKACTDFLENFSRRGIHSECQVILSNFSDTNLPTVIYSRGWESLFGI